MIQGLHVEATNLCTLKCAGCARTQFINRWPKRWQNHSIDIAALDSFLDVDIAGVEVHLCGTYGDPIYHPQLHQLVEMLKHRGAHIKITTNGSHKNQQWWQQLSELLTAQDTVEFSIDGLPDSFMLYRENGDWSSIESAIRVCAQAQVRAGWKYIPFQFNQNSIAQAEQLSQDLGLDYFYIEKGDRFEDVIEHLKPADEFVHDRAPYRQNAQTGAPVELDPKCHQGVMHYISSDGYYMPCCFIHDHRAYYKTPFGKNRNQYSIQDQTISAVLELRELNEFVDTVQTAQPQVCQMNCPRLEKCH